MEITFETAALSAAINKAARVAPTKGAAFDKSAGISLEIRPSDEHVCTVKSTDLEVTYLEWVQALNVVGDDVTWRLSAGLFSGILSNLPMGGGQTVTLSDTDGGYLNIKSGKIKAKMRMLVGVGAYQWNPFDPADLKPVDDFTARVAQVSWACDKNMIPYTGVHINGTHLIATDRYRLARIPCAVPLDNPITVPLEVVSPVLKNVTDALLAAVDKKLLIQPDEHSQITSTIFDVEYGKVDRVMIEDYPQTCTVDAEAFREALQRMMVLCKGERYPLCTLTIGGGRIHVIMDVPEVGEMEDELEVVGAAHDDFKINFTPTYLTDALGNTNHEALEFGYDTTKPNQVVRFIDKDEYTVWVVPRVMGS